MLKAAWVDDRRIALADAEGLVRVGDSPDRPWNIVFRSQRPVKALAAWEKAGEITVAIAAGPDLWLASARGGTPKHAKLSAEILSVRFLGDGTLAVVTTDRLLRKPLEAEPVEEDLGAHFSRAVLSDDGRVVAGVPWDRDDAIKVRRLGEGLTPRTHRLDKGAVTGLAMTPDGARVVVASTEGLLVLLDQEANVLASGRVELSAAAVGISEDGKTVYSVNSEGGIDVWDVSKADPD